jgi:hypothetical protein
MLALVATQASASFDNIVIERATVAPNATATVDLFAEDIDAPGLGAWEIGIFYDPTVVTPVSCAVQNGSVCNPNFDSDQVRVTGASASGLVNTNNLASITFRCGSSSGTSALTLKLAVIADATVGEPQPMDVKQFDGSITCTQSTFQTPPPDSTPGPTNTPAPGETPGPEPTSSTGGLPVSGTGLDSGSGSSDWLIAGATGAVLAAVAGVSMAALRRRSRD